MGKKITIKEASELLGVQVLTLKRWDEAGIFKPNYRTPGNHRRYDYDEVLAFAQIKPSTEKDMAEKVFIYSRVSTKKQADSGNLHRQTQRLKEYCEKENYEIVHIYEEVASGLNDNRRKLTQMLKNLDKVSKIIVEYPDRLARFGLKYINLHCDSNNVEIVFLEDNDKASGDEELVKDLISIITSFSARLYGSRGGRKIAKEFEKTLESVELENNVNE